MSTQPLALLHLCINECMPLLATWFAVWTIVLGVVSQKSVFGIDICERLAACTDELVDGGVWNPSMQVPCSLPAVSRPFDPAYTISLTSAIPAVVNLTSLASALIAYVIIITLFLRQLGAGAPINGAYVSFVLTCKRSWVMKAYVYLSVLGLLALGGYAASILPNGMHAIQLVLGVAAGSYALFSMLNDDYDFLPITSPEFLEARVDAIEWRRFCFGFDAASLKRKIEWNYLQTSGNAQQPAPSSVADSTINTKLLAERSPVEYNSTP
jgi:hypothetical protein